MCHLHESSGTRNQYISSSSNVTVHVKIYRLGFGHVTSQIANHPVFISGIETPYGRRTFVYIRIKVHATPTHQGTCYPRHIKVHATPTHQGTCYPDTSRYMLPDTSRYMLPPTHLGTCYPTHLGTCYPRHI